MVVDANKSAAESAPKSPAQRIKADRSPEAPAWQKEREAFLNDQFGMLPEPVVPEPEPDFYAVQNSRLATLCNRSDARFEPRTNPKVDSSAQAMQQLDYDEEVAKQRLALLEKQMLHMQLERAEQQKNATVADLAIPATGANAPMHGRRQLADSQDGYGAERHQMGFQHYAAPQNDPLNHGQAQYRNTAGDVVMQQNESAYHRGGIGQPHALSPQVANVPVESVRHRTKGRTNGGAWMWGG